MSPQLVLSLVALTMGTPMVSGMLGKQPLVWPPYRAPGTTNRMCPCSSSSLCEPITSVAPYEVFAFITSNTNYLKYDWTRITTIVLFSAASKDSDKIMCYAHSKGVRVSYGADFSLNKLTNVASRAAWVQQQVEHAKYNFLDGINFDFESPISAGDKTRREALSSLVTELTKAFKSSFTNPQVTFDTPWSPNSARHFDYLHIGTTMDFILIMAYDESGSCTAGANANYTKTTMGVKQFMALGISPKRLVLGLPWYGYDYPCGSISKDNHCAVVPKCKGRQVVYSFVMKTLYKRRISGRLWDDASVTPYFNRKNNAGQLCQTWYDDKESLSVKYKFATTAGLRGVGMWTADSIDYSDTPEGMKQRVDMWGALPVVNHHKHKVKSTYKKTQNDVF